jgi:hypothetical protein
VGVEGAPEFSKFLQQQMIFDKVVPPNLGEPVDLLIKAESHGEYRSGGFMNFVSYFPGGLLLVASLRGIRWTYDATARAEVYDTYTDQKVGEYEAKTTHRLVHRASVPGSFFGAAIFVPAIVQGAKHTRVRPVYKRMLSEESYTTLWRQIGGQLMKDHTAYQEIAARAQRQRPSYTSFAGRARVEPQRPAARRPAVLPPSPRPSELTSTGVDFGNYYALVIGNNDYQSLPKLRSAVNDARRISELLRARNAASDPQIRSNAGELLRQGTSSRAAGRWRAVSHS